MLGPVLIGVAAAGVAVVLVLLVALIRHLTEVAGSVRELQRDLVPALERLQHDARRTRDRLERLSGPSRDPRSD